jgi:hypothetical protein
VQFKELRRFNRTVKDTGGILLLERAGNTAGCVLGLIVTVTEFIYLFIYLLYVLTEQFSV